MKFRLSLSILLFLLLSFSSQVFAHTDMMAASKWYFGKDNIVAVIEIPPAVLARLKGIREGHYPIETCSQAEFQRVAHNVIQPELDRRLSITVNERRYPARVIRLDRKNGLAWELWFSMDRVDFSHAVNPVQIDYRLLFEETDDTHINLASLYRFDASAKGQGGANAPPPLARFTFTATEPVWVFSFRGPSALPEPPAESVWKSVAEFTLLGVKHILTGYDHIAFLLALIVIGLSIREMLKIITAFTLAHSITLLLAAMHVISLNSRFVEIFIALSICYVALENVFRKKIEYRWLITFGFGLIHGFGFASGLQELIEGKSNLLVSVLSFNLGVETGQLMIFFVLLPALYLLRKRFTGRTISAVTSAAVFVIGFTWFVERLFDLNLLSF